MKKATFLWGDYKDISIENHFKWVDRLDECIIEKRKRLGALNYRLKNTSTGAFTEMGRIATTIKNEEKRYDKKIEKITKKLNTGKTHLQSFRTFSKEHKEEYAGAVNSLGAIEVVFLIFAVYTVFFISCIKQVAPPSNI